MKILSKGVCLFVCEGADIRSLTESARLGAYPYRDRPTKWGPGDQPSGQTGSGPAALLAC